LADLDRCDDSENPLLAPKVFSDAVRPMLEAGRKTLLVVIDNFRYDQWRVLAPVLNEQWQVHVGTDRDQPMFIGLGDRGKYRGWWRETLHALTLTFGRGDHN